MEHGGIKGGEIIVFVCVILIALLAGHRGEAAREGQVHNSRKSDMVLKQMDKQQQQQEQISRDSREQLQRGEDTAGQPGGTPAFAFSLIHRTALDPRARGGGADAHADISDLLRMDELRVHGFSAYLAHARERATAACEINSGAYKGGPNSDACKGGPVPSPLSSSSSSEASPLSSSSSSEASPPLAVAPSLPPSRILGRDFSTPPSPASEELQTRVISGASLPGNIGQYFVELSIGTPPQKFLFIADTGSDLVWVPCSLCRDCITPSSSAQSPSPPSPSIQTPTQSPSMQPPSSFLMRPTTFDPQISSTFKPIPCTSQVCDLVPPPMGATCSQRFPSSCTYAYQYSDLSQTSGVFAYDTVTMKSTSGSSMDISKVAFGCGSNNTGPSITPVGGVMGLGQGPISFASQAGYLFDHKFSYCFTSFFNRRSSSALMFGDHPMGSKLLRPVQYTPFLPNPVSRTFYYIGIQRVKLAGKNLPIPPSVWAINKDGSGGSVIDSGTTLTFFIQPAYTIIAEAFRATVAYPVAPPTAGLNVCWNVSGIKDPEFPRIAVVMKGEAVFRPPRHNYILNPTEDLRCLGLLGAPAMTVVGNLMQQNYFVEYDRLKKRLGFARAHCKTFAPE